MDESTERQRRALTVKREEEARALVQGHCKHQHPDGSTALGAQEISNGSTFYICGHCFKSWNEDVPPILLVDPDAIGGRWVN